MAISENFGCTLGGTIGKVRERQIILKTDQRKVLLELGLGEKFQAKSSGWDENRTFLEGDVLEITVRNGRWVLTHAPAKPVSAPSPAEHYFPTEEWRCHRVSDGVTWPRQRRCVTVSRWPQRRCVTVSQGFAAAQRKERGGDSPPVRTRGCTAPRRFLMHVLPNGFHRIRHYGLLASGNFGCTLGGTMGKVRERQIILKTDERNVTLELGARAADHPQDRWTQRHPRTWREGKFVVKPSSWDENRVFLEEDKPEVAVEERPLGEGPSARRAGSTLFTPLWSAYLASAHAQLGQFNDSSRCIDQAVTAIEATKERFYRRWKSR
jgi:Putative transposase